MSDKPKVAFYWCASCGGCEETVVDLEEKILDVVAAVDIVFWPVALDFKRKDVEAMPDGAITATFLNGAIRSTEQEEMAHLLRKKSQLLIAFGACSQLGGVPGLANLWDRQTVMTAVYREAPSTINPEGTAPQAKHAHNGKQSVTLPTLFDTVKTLDQTVEVDYYVPGCPPTPKVLLQAVQALLSGKLPEKGAVLAPDTALCEECPRKDTRPEKLTIKEWKRPHEILIDPEKCLLTQGLLCLGSATRGGCDALCIKGNMPCTGCFGPTSRVRDFGGKALSALASIVDSNDETEIGRILAQIPDPVGTLYRYSLPASPLRRKKPEVN
jgi:F420-non-reducing hydrogenase small subunit